MATPNPQPNTSWTAKYRPRPAGSGTSPQGQSQSYKGPKGFFQWGHGQTGYINPQGSIQWAAKPKAGQQMIGYGNVSKWAKATGQTPHQDVAARPAAYLGPDYRQAKRDLLMARKDAMRNLNRAIADTSREGERLFGTNIEDLWGGEFGRAKMTGLEQMQARLAAQGLSGSGAFGLATADEEADIAAARERLMDQFGPRALERMSGERGELMSRYRYELRKLQNQAKQLANLENKERVAYGLAPRWSDKEIMGIGDKGFSKEGSTWFYTNPQGVKVSVQGSPYQKRIRLLQKKLQGTLSSEQEQKIRKQIEALRKKERNA